MPLRLSLLRPLLLTALLSALTGCSNIPILGQYLPDKNKTEHGRSARRSSRAQGDSPKALLQDLETAYADLQSLQARLSENRRREEVAMRTLRERLRQLRSRVERSTAAAPQPSYRNSVSSRSRTAAPIEAPAITPAPALSPFSESRTSPSAPRPTAAKPKKPAAPPPGQAPPPPPFLNTGGPSYEESPAPGPAPSNAPPGPPISRPATLPAPPTPPRRTGEATRKNPFMPLSGVRSGRILQIRGQGKNRTATLDIGSATGIRKGTLLLLGKNGSESALWTVTGVRAYTCTAVPLNAAPSPRGAPGQKMVPVRRR